MTNGITDIFGIILWLITKMKYWLAIAAIEEYQLVLFSNNSCN